MDDIKVGRPTSVTIENIKQKSNTPTPSLGHSNDTQSDDVVVTNHLSKLVDLVSAAGEMPDENARVMEMKQRIKSGDYTVNIPVLSDKLLANGVLKSIGS